MHTFNLFKWRFTLHQLSSDTHNPILPLYIPTVQQVRGQAEMTNQSFLSYTDRIIYNIYSTERKGLKQIHTCAESLMIRCFSGYSYLYFPERSSARQEALNKIHKDCSRSAGLFPASSKAAAIDSPHMYNISPKQQLCVGVHAVLSALFHCSSETQGSTMLSPQQQCEAHNKNLLNFFQCKTGGCGGGVGGCIVHVHRTQNQYSTWQTTLDAVLFARWLIGHGVNSLSIHHGHLRPTVSQAVPKTSSSREGRPGKMDGQGRGKGGGEQMSSPESWVACVN